MQAIVTPFMILDSYWTGEMTIKLAMALGRDFRGARGLRSSDLKLSNNNNDNANIFKLKTKAKEY